MVNVGPTVETHDRRVKKAKLDPGSKEKNVKFLASRDDNKDTATSSVPKARRRIKFAVSDEAKPASKELVTEDSIPASTFKVIVGSYEKLLYGLEGTVSSSSTGYSFHLEPIFIFPAHVSCIKAVAASPHGGKWLATGSADEIIKVWDLRRRKEIGGLMHHEGSITHLEFPSRSHLLSASEDGTLSLFRARDWTVLRSLKGHKGRVNSVAVHPSGKVALSVGKDRMLRMWDLMRGKGSASMKLGKEGETVRWSVDGSRFVVQSQSTLDIYSTDMALLHTITHPSRLHDVKFWKRPGTTGEVLFAASEDGKTSLYEIPENITSTPKIFAEFVGHLNRVKAIDTLSIALPSTTSSPNCAVVKTTTIACTISSDGQIHLYNLASLSENLLGEPQRLEPVVTYDTKGTRLTCLTIAGGDAEAPGVGKRKRLDGGYGSHEDDLDEEGAEAHEDDNAENERDGSGDDLEALPE